MPEPPFSPRFPFFIVGAPRSGTTLLRLMMCMHSRICVPPETHFIPQLVEQLGERWTRAEFLSAIEAHPRFVEMEIDVRAVERRFDRAAAPNWREAFAAVYDEYASSVGKARWGDKTPNYVKHLPLIARIFPDARFIHLIRDGRDVACSLLSVPWFEGGIEEAAREWLRLSQGGRGAGEALGPGRYLEVVYERLVADTESELSRVCTFIGEAMEPAMLEFHRNAEDYISAERMAWHGKTREPVNDGAIGRWRRELSPADLATVESICGEWLGSLGYETEAHGIRGSTPK